MSSVTTMPLIDHEGHHFRRVKDMAAYWGLYPELLSARWRSGLSLEECLTRPCRKQKNPRGKEKGCYDHKGRYFPNQIERARWWHADANLVRSRLRIGWSIEKALTWPGKWERLREKLLRADHAGRLYASGREVTDHTGRLHASKREMCAWWGIRYPLYCSRRLRGWSMEDALLTPPKESPGVRKADRSADHEGRVFPSMREMCEHWGISLNTYRYRVKWLEWSKERALTAPPGRDRTVRDHLGREYDTKSAMCAAWGVTPAAFNYRVRRMGMTMEQALTVSDAKDRQLQDHTGRRFRSWTEMCRFWGVHYLTAAHRMKYRGWTLKEALTEPPIPRCDRRKAGRREHEHAV